MEKETMEQKTQVHTPRFEKGGDGWIKDNLLGLDFGPSSEDSMDFEAAEEYAESKGGRLPTLKELQSIVDYEQHDPAVDKNIFPDTKNRWYWTSTRLACDKDYVWCVGFSYGGVGDNRKDGTGYVRPVRASQ